MTDTDISDLVERLMPYSPQLVVLFGSQAKGTATDASDIDLCVVAHTASKRRLSAELYLALDCELPVDIILYTPEEWRSCLEDETSFAHKILTEGVILYG